MERHGFGKERLKVPTDFTSPRNIQGDLVPPSHFASVPSAGSQNPPGIPPPSMSWFIPAPTSAGDARPANPWLAISQAQQEILELKKENQRIMMLQGNTSRGKPSADHPSDLTVRSSHELEMTRDELSKATTELSQVREELSLCSAQMETMSLQLDNLKKESNEEIKKLRRDLERSKEESREAERSRLRAEEENKQQVFRLLEQLEEMKKKQDVELQQLNTSHRAELYAARKVNGELEGRLQSRSSEVLLLRSALKEASAERDGLKEHLSQMGQAFETQSATLHSLRNYIGQLAPEKGEKDRLNEAVERLNKEKSALQTTTELLTIRLNSVNEILTLQEEKMAKKSATDPLMKNGPDVLQVLHLWREKVFKLCVQLRSKDIEIRREKSTLLSEVKSTEQQLQQEQHRSNVLQHSLQDRVAELDLERVEKEVLKQNLAEVHQKNAELKSQNQKTEADVKTLTSALQRFSQEFETKLTEVDAAKARLNNCTQRLSFANRRVETIQGLLMRRTALQKIEQACKQAEQDSNSIRNLQMEHSLVREERDKLTQELKRTPELIEKALTDLKEQYESKVRQQQQEHEHSCRELRLAAAGREEAEQSLRQIQAQLEESNGSLERLRCELLRQQEQSEHALQESVSQIEERCAEKLREMEAQVQASRREHTRAVMTLRQFQKEATWVESTKQEVFNKQLKKTDKKNFPSVTVTERGLMGEPTQSPTAAPRPSASPGNLQNPSEGKCSKDTEDPPPAGERLLCVLDELRTLSAAVINSSEDSAEEDGQSDGARPSTDDLRSQYLKMSH
ncbi:coiled-coil alpha-helical rod protein 1 isoform X3 [Kryptolebias marmoratus]|uniref:coiled-coil alpha-helical rod protein 1 isoform X3 n=1 Tax=Kryptolebias marmoratus TaxID=37003 RepID=UPI000D52F7B5|nr:coiled-coil alpha-helical rod protein 1 isoform X3 [Kryptolebias marmoratus]